MPATALVLFVVIAAVVPQLGPATDVVLQVIPIYIAFAALAPFLGWLVGRRRTGWPCYCIQRQHAKFARGVAARACCAWSNSRAAGDHRYTNTCRVNQ